MRRLITNVMFDNVCKDILLVDDKINKIESNIKDSVDVLINGSNLYAVKGFTNCYFDGSIEDCDGLLSQGITTVFDFSNNIEVSKKLLELGLTVHVAVGDFDGNNIIDENYLDFKITELNKIGVKNIILFLANPNIEDESQYSEIIHYGKKHNLIISTSVSENLEDVGEIDKQYGMSPIALLESYGFLDFKNLLIDCVCVDKEDVNILTSYDTTICTCPTKNLKNGSGIAPVYSFIKNKLNVVIGGVTNSIFQEVDLCKNLQSGYLNEENILKNKDVLNMVNGNIDYLLNREDDINNDIVLIDKQDILSCTPLNVKLVFANGKVVYNKINE